MKKYLPILIAALAMTPHGIAQTANYLVTASPAAYSTAGGLVQLTVTMTYPDFAVPSLGVRPPAVTWAYVGASGTNVPSVLPVTGDTVDPTEPTAQLGFAFIEPPLNAATFSIVLSYPAGLSGNQTISFNGTHRLNGVLTTVTVASVTLSQGAGGAVPAVTSANSASGAVSVVFPGYTITASEGPILFYSATGLPPGLSLNPATGAISGTPSTAGTYASKVKATNAAGTSAEATVTFTISPAPVPVIAVQPANQTVLTGATATFAVTANNPSTGSLTYQWYFVPTGTTTAQPLTDSTGKRSGTTTATLTISNAATADAGDYVCAVTNNVGTVNSQPALLTVAPRLVRIVGQTAAPSAQVAVPIELVASGVENTVSFTLNWDPAVLSYVSNALGASIPTDGSATVTRNTTQTSTGKLAVLIGLEPGTSFTAGTKSLLSVTFTVNASATDGALLAVSFGDSPTTRRIIDPNSNVLAGIFVDGGVTVSSGLEGDVNGDGQVDAADWVKMGRYVVGLDPAPTGATFMKADTAPRTSKGDALVDAADWVQVGRFVVGLDVPAAAGGPSAPNP